MAAPKGLSIVAKQYLEAKKRLKEEKTGPQGHSLTTPEEDRTKPIEKLSEKVAYILECQDSEKTAGIYKMVASRLKKIIPPKRRTYEEFKRLQREGKIKTTARPARGI